jgi:hypothetical protein
MPLHVLRLGRVPHLPHPCYGSGCNYKLNENLAWTRNLETYAVVVISVDYIWFNGKSLVKIEPKTSMICSEPLKWSSKLSLSSFEN